MFSRLTQGVTTVLQELSGEEHHDGDPQVSVYGPAIVNMPAIMLRENFD